jgi:glycosyltransferase involved in cell wall biosynthesis
VKISCICPTYGRPTGHQWLLEETIESFLRQDYADKELIVLNDCPGQELACQAPGVTVVNIPRRFRSLGEKYNAAIALATGDLIAPWEDDDIALPWRLSMSRRCLGQADYYNPLGYWFLDSEGLHADHPIGVSHGCSLFTRKAFDLVAGYPNLSGAQDQGLHDRLLGHPQVARVNSDPLGPREWYYIYRWGVSPIHLSGTQPHDRWYAEIARRPVEPGHFLLKPHWQEDYLKTTATVLEALGNADKD